MKILLIEDNTNIVNGLKFAFEENSYSIDYAKSIKEAKQYLEKSKIDLIILDISLPDGNGFELYKSTIKKMEIPTIFLTAKDNEEDIVKGLESGADDYLTKPFSTKELIARVKKILIKNNKHSTIQLGDVLVDLDKMQVLKNNENVELTALELRILTTLVLNKNNIVKREVLLDKIWEWTGNDVDDHTLTVYIKRIKDKLGKDIITTIKGLGYRIDG